MKLLIRNEDIIWKWHLNTNRNDNKGHESISLMLWLREKVTFYDVSGTINSIKRMLYERNNNYNSNWKFSLIYFIIII